MIMSVIRVTNHKHVILTCITADSIKIAGLITLGWNFPSALDDSSGDEWFSHRCNVATRQERCIMNWNKTDTATDLWKTLLGGLDGERLCRGLACKRYV
jgi:hypothetical protein